MPRAIHDQWYGFTRITSDDGKKKAKCNMCQKVMVNTSSTFLERHRTITCSSLRDISVNLSASPNSNTRCNSSNVRSSSVTSKVNAPATSNANPRIEPRHSLTSHNLTIQEEIQPRQETMSSFSDHLNSDSTNQTQTVPLTTKTTQACKEPSDRNKKHSEYDEALVVMFGSLPLDFSLIQSWPLVNLLSIVDNSYKPPTADQLVSVTLNSVYNKCLGNHQQLNLAYLMGVIVQQSDTSSYATAFLIKNKKYFYVDSLEVDSVNAETLIFFIQSCMEQVYILYKASVSFVILESKVMINNILIWEAIIDNECKIFDAKVYTSFNETIDNLCDKVDNILAKKLNDQNSLGEAVENLFELYEESEPFSDLKEVIENEMLRFLQPISLASNYMDYRFQGKKFVNSSTYSEDMFKVLYDLIPETATEALCLYKNKDEIFSNSKFSHVLLKHQITKYWKLIAKEQVKDPKCNLSALAEFALLLVELPSCVRKIDLHEMQYIFNCKTRGNEMLTAVIGCAVLNKKTLV